MEASAGVPVFCEGLGYEGMAAGIEKGKSLSFDFGCTADSIEVELRMLPNHPVDGDDLRVRIHVDGQPSDILSYRTVGRSEEWKMNVLYNQAVRKRTFPIDSARRTHRVTVTALDEGVVLDQIYVYEK